MNRLFEAEVFCLVVNKGSFTAAAERLNITKSYASKIITRLEDRLGIRLLQRTTRNLTLTEPGRVFYERCSEVMRTLEAAEAEATLQQTQLRGHLRISLPVGFGLTYLVKPLAEFKAHYPDLTIETDFTDRYTDLLVEGIDVAVRVGNLHEGDLIARKLATADVFPCASEAYLAQRGEPQNPNDLIHHDCIRYTYQAVRGTWKLNGPSGAVDIAVSGSLMTNNATMLLEAACQGLGIVLMPVFHTAPYLRDGRLRRVLPKWQSSVAIQVVFPNARHVPLKVRVFVDYLVKQFQNPPWAD
jgi:DNA-binding transcriptional LysR family regulator